MRNRKGSSGKIEKKRKVTHETGETIQTDQVKGIKTRLATSRFPAGLLEELVLYNLFFSSEPFNLLSSEDTRLFVLVSWMATPAVVYKPNLKLSYWDRGLRCMRFF